MALWYARRADVKYTANITMMMKMIKGMITIMISISLLVIM